MPQPDEAVYIAVQWYTEDSDNSGLSESQITTFKRYLANAAKMYGTRVTVPEVRAEGSERIVAKIVLRSDPDLNDRKIRSLVTSVVEKAHARIIEKSFENASFDQDIVLYVAPFYSKGGSPKVDTTAIKVLDVDYNPEAYGQQRLFACKNMKAAAVHKAMRK